jgi:hypothetical protein
VVALADAADAGAGGFDDPGAFVSQDDGHGERRPAAVGGVEAGVADAAGDELDPHLALAGVLEIDLPDADRSAAFFDECRPDAHGAVPFAASWPGGARRDVLAGRGAV